MIKERLHSICKTRTYWSKISTRISKHLSNLTIYSKSNIGRWQKKIRLWINNIDSINLNSMLNKFPIIMEVGDQLLRIRLLLLWCNNKTTWLFHQLLRPPHLPEQIMILLQSRIRDQHHHHLKSIIKALKINFHQETRDHLQGN